MAVFDLNFDSHTHLGHASSTQAWKGMANVYGTDRLLTVDGLLAKIRIQPVREPLPGQLPAPQVLLSGSIPVHGFRATDLSRESSRYSNLFAGPSAQALSRRHPRQGLSQYLGRGQREPRLAHLCRLCAGAHPHRPKAVRQRGVGPPTWADGVCPRLQHHRSLSFALPLGSISQTQGWDQTPYFNRLTRQHSLFYPHHRCQNTRRQHPRRIDSGTDLLLPHGPRLYRLPSFVYLYPKPGLLPDSSQKQPRLPTAFLPPGGQIEWPAKRSDHYSQGVPGARSTIPIRFVASLTGTRKPADDSCS